MFQPFFSLKSIHWSKIHQLRQAGIDWKQAGGERREDGTDHCAGATRFVA